LESKAEDKIDWAFRQAFARPAAAGEKQVIEELLVEQRAAFDEGRAEELLAAGEQEGYWLWREICETITQLTGQNPDRPKH
ncbi:MAG: hypothetical protein RIE56_00790, partial [Amphiplicatus sp.]